MERRNIVGLEARRGYRTVELYQGDLTALGCAVDVVVVSAFAGSYVPSPGTVLGALQHRLGVNTETLLKKAEFDFRSSLGVWISRPIRDCEFSRILCVELIGGSVDVEEALRNVFVALLVLEAKGVTVRSVALPVLGAGLQALELESVVRILLAAVRDYFTRSSQIDRVLFVEINETRVMQLDEAMNSVLGRSRVTLPKSILLKNLREEIRVGLHGSTSLFIREGGSLRDDWLRVLGQDEPASFELGVLSRKLVEHLVSQLPATQKNGSDLRSRIDGLGSIGVATWIRGYMHVLRHVGNESAHESGHDKWKPRYVSEGDLALCLLCVQRLLEFWNTYSESFESALDA